MSHAISDQLLQRFDVPGPRYTSYPTADRFVEAFNESDYIQALEQRRVGSMALPLSLYVHIPFCESVCYYCACNKVITRHHSRAAEYLRRYPLAICVKCGRSRSDRATGAGHYQEMSVRRPRA